MGPTASTPAAELHRALHDLDPRSTRFLSLRLVQGRSLEECARFFGISPGAAKVHLLRASLELAGARSDGTGPNEEAEATAFTAALDGAAPIVADRLLAPLEAASRLRAQASEIQAMEERAFVAADSPEARRAHLARNLIIGALVILGAILFLGDSDPVLKTIIMKYRP